MSETATHCQVQAREALRVACTAQQEIRWQVHVAATGQAVDASSGSSSYRVSLSDELLNSLQFRSMGEYRLAWLNARVKEAEVTDTGEKVTITPLPLCPCTCCL